MKKCLFCVLVFCSFLSFSDAAPTQLNSLKAIVNGEPITQIDLDQAVRTQVQMYFMKNKDISSAAAAAREVKNIEQNALNDLIDRKLILSEFKTMGASIPEKVIDQRVDDFINSSFKGDRDEFIRNLNKQGLTLNQFRAEQHDQIAIQALRSRHAERNNNFSLPHEREAMYQKIKGEYATETKLKVRMISIPKSKPGRSPAQQKELVDDIRSKIANGSSFSEMAKMYSHDSLASKGGFLGTITRQGPLNPTLTNIAYGLSNGRVSKAIDDGPSWRLIYVDSREGGSTPSKKDLAEEIEKRLRIDKQQQALEGWLKKLRRDSNIRIFQ